MREVIKMSGKNAIKSTIISVILAAAVVVSSAFLFSGIKAKAETHRAYAHSHSSQKADNVGLPDKTTNTNQFAKCYVYRAAGETAKGYDWTYKTDYDNVKVKCNYDFTTHKYTFKLTGKSYGLNHFVLRYKTSDKKWASVKMTLFVDSEKNIMRIS